MSVVNLQELLQYGERLTLECKKSQDELPTSVWETYSSFANTSGGVILLGIKEDIKEHDLAKRFTTTKIRNPNKIISDFWNLVNNHNKISANILVDSNVGTIEYQGDTVIWIEVPPASYKQRPVYINGNPLNGTFKRNFEGDYHCTEDEVKAMLRDASDSGNDGGMLDNYTMDDVDTETLKAYRVRFERQNPAHVFNGYDDKEFLRNLGGYVIDRSTMRLQSLQIKCRWGVVLPS